MSAIAFAGVTLALSGRTILRDVSFEIGDREFVGVLGANGAGKTTLFRAILGLVPPASGAIRVLGDAPARGHTSIGYMPQQRSLPALRLSGRDFVLSAQTGHRWGLPVPRGADRRAVERALGMVGATALAARPLAELSGGERQRLLLAGAVLGRPKLLLLDEPLVSLDPRHAAEVVGLARELGRSLGISVLFSAHELNPLLPALDRVLYLGHGGAAIGSVGEIVTGPVLSRLYDAPIDVVRAGGRIFVMSGGSDIERGAHCRDGHR